MRWQAVEAAVSGIVLGLMLTGAAGAADQPPPPRRSMMVIQRDAPPPVRDSAGHAALGLPGVNSFAADCDLAERGSVEAAYRLGRRFLFGVDAPRDRNMGLAWMRAAASRGQLEARRLVSLIPDSWGLIRPWCRPGGAPVRGVQAPPAEIARMVREIAPQYGIDPALVLAVIQVESAYKTDALSAKEAAGLMQLIPATASRFGVHNVYEPAENIRGGVKYLRWLMSYFRGDLSLALAGYNAGEGAVNRFGGIPPYPETTNYVRLITKLYGRTVHAYDPSVAAPSPLLGPATAVAAR